MTMSDHQFAKIVNDDVREAVSEADAQFLRAPEQLDRWQNELIKIKLSVEKQLANKRADRAKARTEITTRKDWLGYCAEIERWRASTIRLLNGVDLRLVEVRNLRRQTSDSALWSAIVAHKQAVLADEDAEAADEKLWRAAGV